MIKVVLTAAGFQGGYDLVKYLKSKGMFVIGTDVNGNCAARNYCDKFYKSPYGNSEGFIPFLMDVCNKERPQVILPASSTELYQLSLNKDNFEAIGTRVVVSDPQYTEIALDKFKTYKQLSKKIKLPFYLYSEKGLVAKPTDGKGGRGVKMLQDTFVTERLDGEALDVDTISWKGELLSCLVKTRERAYGGTIMEGEVVDRPYIVWIMQKILSDIKLDYMCVTQFIGGKLLEINPRIPGGIIDYEMPYMSILLALGKITPDEIKNHKIKTGKRFARYLTQYEY